MEAADPFAPSTDEDDPFKDDLEPSAAEDAVSEVAAEPAEEPPIVDREGVRVEGGPSEAGQRMAAEAAAKAEAAQEQPAAPESAAAAPAPTEAPPEPAPAGDGQEPPQEPPAPPATGEPDADASQAAEPQREGGKKVETRLYKLLYQTGQTQWQEADLREVPPEMKPYIAEDNGELFLKARNNEHAARLAFSALNSPKDGVTVELVARTGWKPKRLKVAPPEPTKTRLVIS